MQEGAENDHHGFERRKRLGFAPGLFLIEDVHGGVGDAHDVLEVVGRVELGVLEVLACEGGDVADQGDFGGREARIG